MACGSGRLLQKYKMSDVFIETGTLDGVGIRAALRAGYKHVISIELDHEKWWSLSKNPDFVSNEDRCVDRLWGPLRHPIIKRHAETTSPTYFLDAHFSGDGTAGTEGCKGPWAEELDAILDISGDKPFVVMIDDVAPTGVQLKVQ